MTYTFDDYNYVVKLNKGERLTTALEQFCDATGVQGAWINGIGGALEATIGYFNIETKQYEWHKVDGMHEVISLNGNLATDKDGNMLFHLHGVLGDGELRTVGGHVKDIIVGPTMELFVHRTWKPLRRVLDTEVGLQTLDL